MPAPPARVLDHLRGVQVVRTRAWIDTGTWLGVGEKIPVQVMAGTVTDSRGSQWRRTIDAVLHPDTHPDLTLPYGHRLLVEQGIDLPDQQTVWAGVGVVRLQTRPRRTRDAGWSVTGRSLEAAVIDAQYAVEQTLSGGSCIEVLTRELQAVLPEAVVSVQGVEDAPMPLIVAQSRWEALTGAEGICGALGAELFTDGYGRWVLRKVPTVLDGPVWSASGVEVHETETEVSREGVFNHVVAFNDRAELGLVRGEWEDIAPGSRTRVGGPFNRVTLAFPNPLLTSNEQAAEAARTRGEASLGLASSMAFTSVHNPWSSAGDVVSALGTPYLLDRLVTPLGGGRQSAQTRTGTL